MGWKIEVDGATLHEDDVIAAHVSIVAELAELDDWSVVDPIRSPKLLTIWTALAASLATGRDMDQTLMWAQSLPIAKLVQGYTPDAPAAPETPLPPPTPAAEAQPEPSVQVDEKRAAWVNQMAAHAQGR